MRRIAAGFLFLLLPGGMVGAASDVYTLIREGNLEEAADSLSVYSSAARRDGRLLFFQSFLEKDGTEAARQMEAALNAQVPTRFREEIYYRLSQYYCLVHDYRKLAALVSEHRAFWETGRYEAQMSRLGILADQLSGDYESALRNVDRYLLRHGDGERAQWGMIDKARILAANNKGIGADKLLHSLSRADNSAGGPQALYLLTVDAIRQRRADDAVFSYNLLRERYPHAVGLDHLVELFDGISEEASSDGRAEAVTGTYYSVKVGVFAEKQNARDYADLFRSYDRKVDVQAKTISGKNYHVVYVGRFAKYEEARIFMKQLESTHHEAYQVVAR